MSTRGFFLCLLVSFSCRMILAQPFPEGPKPKYLQGHAFVKIREESRSVFETPNPSSRLQNALPGFQAALLSRKAKTEQQQNAGARRRPVHVDMSLFYEVTFDASQPLETALEKLRQSGHFELVEPVPISHLLYTPNDVNASQYYLQKIKAMQAWDITKGSDQVVIAIVDTGGELTHPDLAGNLYHNKGEIPNNGIDDDKDGYIDNVTGWDFAGSDTADVTNPSFIGDNDPSIHGGGEFSHGTFVAGCASAATDNGIGIAGVGFNTKILFTKHTAENALPNRTFLYNAYQGVLYAAETLSADSVKVIINCSFGGEPPSQIIQSLINYVTLDLGCLVVAAAGNSGNAVEVYPASYDNVISVAASNSTDNKAGFSTYNTEVDITAPGEGIYSTFYDDTYITSDGTSFSSPIVSGAAALVWAVHPDYTFDQIAEQLRVSADTSLYTINPTYRNQLGSGRLDVYNALTLHSPSLRALHVQFLNSQGTSAGPGDAGMLYMDVENLLEATSANVQIAVTSSSPGVTVNRGVISPGVIGTKQTYSNALTPFIIDIDPAIALDEQIALQVVYTDGQNYKADQIFTFVPNPSYINADQNRIITSIASDGRIGFMNPGNLTGGVGFQLDDTNMLSEMGIIMGTSVTNLFNNVRSTPPAYDQSIVNIGAMHQLIPGLVSDKEITGALSNSATVGSQQVLVSYKVMDWQLAPNDKFVIMEYTFQNPTSVTLSNFFFGLFADWDISPNGATDEASWNDYLHLGYVNAKDPATARYAGIQLLTGNVNYYAIDNDPAISGSSIGLYDGFTHAEKFASVSSGIARTDAGTSSTGDDVSHVVAAGPLAIGAGQKVTIAFALHGATSLPELFNSALYADSLYNIGLKLTPPVLADVKVCPGTQAILVPSGGTNYNWYTDASSKPFLKASFYTQNDVQQNEVIYVTSVVGSYESKRDTVQLDLYPRVVASFQSAAQSGSGDQLIQFTDTSVGAVKWNWNFGDNTTSTAQNPLHVFNDSGDVKVQLEIESQFNCKDTISHVMAVVTGVDEPVSDFSIYPNPVKGSQMQVSSAGISGDVSVTLTDMQGVVVYENVLTLAGNQFSIPVSGIAEGLYVVTITHQSKVSRAKVVKYAP